MLSYSRKIKYLTILVCQGDWIDERRGPAVCVGEDKVTVGKMVVVESTWPLELC